MAVIEIQIPLDNDIRRDYKTLPTLPFPFMDVSPTQPTDTSVIWVNSNNGVWSQYINNVWTVVFTPSGGGLTVYGTYASDTLAANANPVVPVGGAYWAGGGHPRAATGTLVQRLQ